PSAASSRSPTPPSPTACGTWSSPRPSGGACRPAAWSPCRCRGREFRFTMRLLHVSHLLVLLGHAVIAAAWGWVMPRGFPPDHPRFWVNGVAPPAALVLLGLAIVAARRRRWNLTRSILLMIACFWIAMAASNRLVFPHSRFLLWLAPLAIGGICLLA